MSAHSRDNYDIIDFFRDLFGCATDPMQDFAHFPQQRCWAKWLFEIGEAGFEHAVPDDGVISVARHEKHLERGLARLQLIGQLSAAHSWHDDIGQQHVHVEIGAPAIHQRQRRRSVRGFQDRVAVSLEQLSSHRPDRCFILDQQDRLAAAQDLGGQLPGALNGVRWFIHPRQVHAHRSE